MHLPIRAILYFGILTGLFLGVGWFVGGRNGVIIAFLVSTATNILSYWFSDRIVLFLYHARPIPERASPELHQMVREIVQQAQLPMPRLYLIDIPTPNAFATGRDPTHAAVALTRGIVDLLTKEELKGVLAHELSHVQNRDVLIATVAATIAGAISMLARIVYWGGAFVGGDRDRENRIGGALSFFFFVIATPLLAMLIQLAISRSREFQADASGAKLVGSGISLANALLKLHEAARAHPIAATHVQHATAHLFIVNPFTASVLTNLFSTHPRVEERVRRLHAMQH